MEKFAVLHYNYITPLRSPNDCQHNQSSLLPVYGKLSVIVAKLKTNFEIFL